MTQQTPESDQPGPVAPTSAAREPDKGVKRWVLVTAATVVVVLLGATLAWRSLDPAKLKSKIVAAVMQDTGLELRIEDDIKLSLFPLSLELGTVELENAPGFSRSFLLRSQSLGVHVKLLPLLRKQIDMQTLNIKGLELNLERDRYGNTNWETLLSQASPDGTPPSAAALAVGGVSIQDASVRFDDQETRVSYSLSDIAVTSGALTTDKPADMRIEFAFSGQRESSYDPLGITGDATIAGKITVDLGVRTAHITGLELLATASGDTLTEGEAQLSVTGAVEYAFPSQTLSFRDLKVVTEGFKLAGVGNDMRLQSPATSVHVYTGLVQLEALDLQSDLRGPLVPGGAMQVALGGNLAFNPTTSVLVAEDLRVDVPRIVWSDTELRVAFYGDANADLANNTLSIPNLDLKTTVASPMFAGVPIDTRLRAALDVDMWGSGVVLRGLRFEALDVLAAGDMGVMDPLRRPALSGALRIDAFNPRNVLERLGYAPPDTRDAQALTHAQLSARVVGTRDGAALQELVLEVDDTRLTGQVGARRFGRPRFYAELHADEIDLDRYRCQACQRLNTAGTTFPAASVMATLPLDRLRALDVSTRMRIDRLHAARLTLAAMDIGLRGDQGLVELQPFSGALYDGRYDGHVIVDTRADPPTLSVAEQLAGLNLGALLRALGLEPQPILSDATADAELRLEATSEVSGERLAIQSLTLDASLNTTSSGQAPLTLGIRATGNVSVPETRLELEDIELALGGLSAAGRLNIEDADANPRFTGRLSVKPFDPRGLAASLGLPAPSTADPKAFRSLALSTRFAAGADRLRLDDVAITLDDTRATGYIDLTRLAMPPALRFELAVGNLDANRYLPLPAGSEQPKPSPALWPLAALRALDVEGVITAERMRLTDMQLDNVKLRVTARDGELRIQPPEPNEQVDREPQSERVCVGAGADDVAPSCTPRASTATTRHDTAISRVL